MTPERYVYYHAAVIVHFACVESDDIRHWQ